MSADTCFGAVNILTAFSSACRCPEVCTGGTGSCAVDQGAAGRCSGSCEEQCDPSQCGTDACSQAAEDFGRNAEQMVTGFTGCTGPYAPHAAYAQMGADYLRTVAVDKLSKCGLQVPASLTMSADTCFGAVNILTAFSSACRCPEVCTGGTGSCAVDQGAAGRCSGSCEEQCDPSQCGTDACSQAVANLATNAEHMVTGFTGCSGHMASYAAYGQYGAAYLEHVASEKLAKCGLTTSAPTTNAPTTNSRKTNAPTMSSSSPVATSTCSSCQASACSTSKHCKACPSCKQYRCSFCDKDWKCNRWAGCEGCQACEASQPAAAQDSCPYCDTKIKCMMWRSCGSCPTCSLAKEEVWSALQSVFR